MIRRGSIHLKNSALILIFAVAVAVSACNIFQSKRFTVLKSEDTGITFRNDLTQTPDLNIFNYLYFYDGGGVAAGDLNGDNLPDLFFTSNQNRNRLYLNRGKFKFEDITDQAIGDVHNDWTTGVSFADVNADGKLDIYVCNVGSYLKITGENKLYINQGSDENGIPRFKEEGKKYGLDLVGFSTQAAFFDYDRDGDLDMYMLNHSVHSNGTFGYASKRNESHPLAGDRLMQNNGNYFVDVTDSANIYNSALGYGLGIGISDINNDGWPDIYVGNDFHEDDYLYLNNRDGTFREVLGKMIQHTSRSSMGNDLIDLNNDGLVDIFSLDMLPGDYETLKASAAEDPLEIFKSKLRYGYKYQFSRNTLQLNRGDGHFSEIGLMAGVYATGWSWAALGADFDNNGHTDLFVSNGIKGRTNDLDYIRFISNDNIQYRLSGEITEEELALTDKMPEENVHNFMFSNTGSLILNDVSEEWGFNSPTFSNGAAYVDLDGDGDLDIVTNNVNAEPAVYRNNTRENFDKNNYLKIRFNGPSNNPFGVGTKVSIVRSESSVLMREMYPIRGYQSSVAYELHFGLDSLKTIPTIHIQWPDGKQEELNNVSANQVLKVSYSNARVNNPGMQRNPSQNQSNVDSPFVEITDQFDINYKHEENEFIEFNREPLIPHMVSSEGPAMTVGDVNGDGLQDFYAGGAKRQAAKLFVQTEDGKFQERKEIDFENDFIQEDVDALFNDFDEDGDQDLLVVTGGNEYYGHSEYMLSRLYLNDGKGNFSRDRDGLPDLFITGSVAAAGDVDGDGDLDLFIGARTVPWNYGEPPKSALLINENGTFKQDTSTYGKHFSDLSMVTGAKWADMDGNGRKDLIVAAEWSPVRVVYNQSDTKVDVKSIDGSSGLWKTLQLSDIDKDGRLDILAGNLGLNSKFHASPDAPLRMYFNDFDGNGKKEQLVTLVDQEGKERIFATRDELAKQLDYIDERFKTYHEYAAASLDEVVDPDKLSSAIKYEVTELRSVVFYNKAEGYKKVPMPVEAQFTPMHVILPLPEESILTAGNFYDANIQRGWYDAGYGQLMVRGKQGKLQSIPNKDINWFLEGQIRKIKPIKINGKQGLIIAENGAPLRLFQVKDNAKNFITEHH